MILVFRGINETANDECDDDDDVNGVAIPPSYQPRCRCLCRLINKVDDLLQIDNDLVNAFIIGVVYSLLVVLFLKL
jgi:hypothetical protein